MTIIYPVEEMDELELKIAASSAIDKKTVALHVRQLNAAAGLTTGPSPYGQAPQAVTWPLQRIS
jgi:hypothetical protein